jgi:hypothetical protein
LSGAGSNDHSNYRSVVRSSRIAGGAFIAVPLLMQAVGRNRIMSHYGKFAGMIIVGTLTMYPVMYLNTYVWEHVFWSETRAFMTLIMGSVMTVVMWAFMRGMLKRQKLNVAILLAAALVFGSALYLVRSQTTIDDVSYMKAMIPHHSIAILTSKRARIQDPEVRALADKIIQSQQEEIEEMKRHIAKLQAGKVTIDTDAPTTSD